MPIKYQRDPITRTVSYTDLLSGSFYRGAGDSRPEPVVYLATDENMVVRLDNGVQFARTLHDDYFEVNVEITVGGDA